MKKLLSLFLVLLLVAWAFPTNAIAQTDEGFEIKVEKITDDPDYLKFQVTAEDGRNLIAVHCAYVDETFYNAIKEKDKIMSFLKDIKRLNYSEITFDKFWEIYKDYPGKRFSVGGSSSAEPIEEISVRHPKYAILNNYFKELEKQGVEQIIYFLCLAEDEKGNLSEIYEDTITVNDVEIGKEYENVKDALGVIQEYISGHEDKALRLLSTLKGELDEKDKIIGTLFANLNDNIKERLENAGITAETLSEAYRIFKEENGYEELESMLEDKIPLSEDGHFITWAKLTFDEIFKKDNAPLKKFYDKVIDEFDNFRSFLVFIKNNEVIAKNNLTVVYDNGRISIKENMASDLFEELNEALEEKEIAPISQQEDIDSIISAANEVLKNFTGEDAKAIAEYLKAQKYDVEGLPSETPPEGEPGGIGGGGGGGGTAPGKPEIKIPEDDDKPVTVEVPSDVAEVTVDEGKAVVTFDEKTVSNLLKLLDEAVEKAKGKKLALVINLTDREEIADKATIELPADLAAKAFEKGAALTVNLKKVGIDIPAGSVETKDIKGLKINVETKDANEVLKNIEDVEKMKPVGSAMDVSVLAGDSPASFKKKLTLRFSIKGLTTNIDKLGIYFINENEGRAEFVGGKVDRASGEIRANLSHLSTYALLEYDKTFDDIAKHWAKDYVESMAAKHVVHGRTPQKFVPDDGITRAEFAKLMVNALELDIVPYKGSFEDVATDAWYADYIETAYQNGLITGRIEGKVFDPSAKITRQEIMAIVGRALSRKPSKDADALLAPFIDAAKVEPYAKDHAALLVELGIVNGYPDGTLRPEANTTRAEAVKLIYGLYNN
ncbi:MAG: S-layer homology domain-containing protein [Thermosediminibacteraceae bacterium]|nr:S-layer homology domain-containing protein [Thermosediminibacteraceae bacterium]